MLHEGADRLRFWIVGESEILVGVDTSIYGKVGSTMVIPGTRVKAAGDGK